MLIFLFAKHYQRKHAMYFIAIKIEKVVGVRV